MSKCLNSFYRVSDFSVFIPFLCRFYAVSILCYSFVLSLLFRCFCAVILLLFACFFSHRKGCAISLSNARIMARRLLLGLYISFFLYVEKLFFIVSKNVVFIVLLNSFLSSPIIRLIVTKVTIPFFCFIGRKCRNNKRQVLPCPLLLSRTGYC